MHCMFGVIYSYFVNRGILIPDRDSARKTGGFMFTIIKLNNCKMFGHLPPFLIIF